MRDEVTLGESRFRFLKVQYARSEMKGTTLFSRIQKNLSSAILLFIFLPVASVFLFCFRVLN